MKLSISFTFSRNTLSSLEIQKQQIFYCIYLKVKTYFVNN